MILNNEINNSLDKKIMRKYEKTIIYKLMIDSRGTLKN